MAAPRTTFPRSAERTRERILDASLALFNASGAPQVTTNHIADAAFISPGNLYYHYRHKEDIVMALYRRYEAALARALHGGPVAPGPVLAMWQRLLQTFRVIRDFRFVHRDLSELSATYPALRTRVQRGVAVGIERATAHCLAMADAGALQASPEEARALGTSITLVTTYWFNLHALQHAGRSGLPAADDDAVTQGALQVLSLLAPYWRGALRDEYLQIVAQAHGSLGMSGLPGAGASADEAR